MSGPEPLGDIASRIDRLRGRAQPSSGAPAAAVDSGAVLAAREALFVAQVPPRFVGARVGHLDPWLQAELHDWRLDPGGRNVVLSGPAGAGKTYAAVATVRRRALYGDSVFLTSAVVLLQALRPGGDPTALDRARTARLVLLDDLGAERPTDWTAEQLAALIDHRWTAGLPIVATTNLSLGPDGQLVEALGERAYSRLVGSGALALRVSGPDRRRAKVPEQHHPTTPRSAP